MFFTLANFRDHENLDDKLSFASKDSLSFPWVWSLREMMGMEDRPHSVGWILTKEQEQGGSMVFLWFMVVR